MLHDSDAVVRPQEACGVFGIYAPGESAARLTFFALYALQHRGQEAAGIAVPCVTGAGTGTYRLEAASAVWNEIQPGSYIFMDADYGRILVGIQVPRGDEADFGDFLRTLAYPCVEETHNPVYDLFLR